MAGLIVGREQELAEIDEFLDEIRGSSAVLLIEGEPGIGKSTLWQAAVGGGHERSWRTLVARPVESEAKLSFVALGDLLERELGDALPDLPAPQRRALEVALLRKEASWPPEQRAIAVGVLGALRVLAEAGPILLAVDDVQWLDTASAAVLEFAVRRLRDEPVGVVFAWRVEGSAPLPLGLHRGVSGTLRRIRAGQNPFFALELARALQQQRRPIAPGERVAMPEELQTLVAARLADLPERTRETLLVAAAMSHSTLPMLTAALGEDPEPHLGPALEAKVVDRQGEAITFAHPLLASAAYSRASPVRRRDLHRLLADLATDVEERARHLALSTLGPDERVASSLEEAARRAFARGAPHAAVELSGRARNLTPVERQEDLRRRSASEAEYRLQAGDPAGARDILEAVLATCPTGPDRMDALSRLADTHQFGLDWRSSANLYRQVLAERGENDSARTRSELGLASALSLLRAPVPEIVAHARAARRLAEGLGDRALLGQALAMEAWSALLDGRGFQTSLIERACALAPWMEGVPFSLRPSHYLALMLARVDDLAGALAEYQTLLQQAREHGDEVSLAWLLGRTAQVECLTGAWEEALHHIAEGEEVLLQAGQPANVAFLLSTRALVEAHLGRVASARLAGECALELAARVGAVLVRSFAAWALGFLELSLARPARAHDYLGPLVAETRSAAIQEPGEMHFVPDEIEALTALGDLQEAEILLGWFEERGLALNRPSALAAAARCRGKISAARADLDDALVCFQEALLQHERVSMPFERARTLHALGSAQRRARERRAARQTLEQGVAIFEGLGAESWAWRTRAELARISGRPPGSGLTPAERRVAELVAEGRTNKEVAAELVVTVRTVESTLTKVYAKLGVRSRTELSRRLGTGHASSRS